MSYIVPLLRDRETLGIAISSITACLFCSRYASASDTYRVANGRQHDAAVYGKLTPVKKRDDQSRAREPIRLANEGRRKQGASAAWPTLLGIVSAHPKMDIAKHLTYAPLVETTKSLVERSRSPEGEERVWRKNIPCGASMRRTTAATSCNGDSLIPFHFRSSSEMNEMKGDDMSLDRLPNRVRCLSARLWLGKPCG